MLKKITLWTLATALCVFALIWTFNHVSAWISIGLTIIISIIIILTLDKTKP